MTCTVKPSNPAIHSGQALKLGIKKYCNKYIANEHLPIFNISLLILASLLNKSALHTNQDTTMKVPKYLSMRSLSR